MRVFTKTMSRESGAGPGIRVCGYIFKWNGCDVGRRGGGFFMRLGCIPRDIPRGSEASRLVV